MIYKLLFVGVFVFRFMHRILFDGRNIMEVIKTVRKFVITSRKKVCQQKALIFNLISRFFFACLFDLLPVGLMGEDLSISPAFKLHNFEI